MPPSTGGFRQSLVALLALAALATGGVARGDDAPKVAEEYTFTFKYAAWEDVLELYAEQAGLTLDAGDVPTGTFSYVDRNTYTAGEALDILNGYLMPRGYALVRRDDFLVCVDLTQGIPANLVPNVELKDLPKQPANSLVSVIIPLSGEKSDPKRTAEELKTVVGEYGEAQPLSSARAIVVRATAGNALRIATWLMSIEDFDPEALVFRSYQFDHITADVAAEMLGPQLGVRTAPKNISRAGQSALESTPGGGPPGTVFVQRGQPQGSPQRSGDDAARRAEEEKRREEERARRLRDFQRDDERKEEKRRAEARQATASGTSKIRITADTNTNRLFLTASTITHIRAEQILDALDVPPHPDYVPVERGEPYLRAYKCKHVRASEVAKTLTAIDPDMVVNEDGYQQYIHIWGDDSVHRDARAFLREIDTEHDDRALSVIPLAKLDPLAVGNTLRTMFLADGEDAPIIEADLATRALMVRATGQQTEMIRKLLADLGEDGQPRTGPVGEGNVRTIPLNGVDPDELLPLIEKLWNSANGEQLRIIPNDRPTVRRRYTASQRERAERDRILREQPR